ncbi:MAG: U32 family peptidase C-terminal domain-containing protein [bacterium]|nr:U32 family peptidase C-terminal domain-containing protein [bacterium]
MTEILSPAGNFEKLKVALAYGADAVYLAGRRFGLRSAADNFTPEQLGRAVSYAHQLGARVYLALNGVLQDQELAELPDWLAQLPGPWPDAAICSDLGVIRAVQRYSPMPVHLSTQASLLNSEAAQLYGDLGVKRLVLGREVSLEEAARIKENSGLEVEAFVQGAMCMSYSGQCTISNYMAGRDSNRGGCVHSCRFEYQLFDQGQPQGSRHFMSAQDLKALRLLGRFKELGIDAAKIEGRMKSALYLATTTRAYRGVMDQLNHGGPVDWDLWDAELEKISHRDYDQGNLEQPAGYDSVFTGQEELSSQWELAGTVLEVDPGRDRFAMLLKNRLFKGDSIELLGFGPQILTRQATSLTNLQGKDREVAQPGQAVWLPGAQGVAPQMVARRPHKSLGG